MMHGKMKPESKKAKKMPMAIVIAVKPSKAMPVRGQRTATNMASKAKKK